MKEKQNMTPTETEHVSRKALELYCLEDNMPVSLLALSTPEHFLETASTVAQIACSELKGDRNKPSKGIDLEFCTHSIQE